MNIALTPQFLRQYKDLAAADQRACDAAVEALPAAFGHPHRHTGLGLRALRRGVYECRVNQACASGSRGMARHCCSKRLVTMIRSAHGLGTMLSSNSEC